MRSVDGIVTIAVFVVSVWMAYRWQRRELRSDGTLPGALKVAMYATVGLFVIRLVLYAIGIS